MNALAYGKISQQTQETLVKMHVITVKRIAHHLLTRLPSSVQFDDLMQAGLLGLLEAVRHYDETKGASFETYASIRIRGYMLDEVRRNDWVPRSVYRNSRTLATAVKKVENRYGREAKDHEVAEELQLDLDAYYELVKESAAAQLIGFEEGGVSDETLFFDSENAPFEPHLKALYDENKKLLKEAIDALPENERLVIAMYYERDLNLKDIGKILGVSESRVSQIHSQATMRIRGRLPLVARKSD